MKGRFLLAVVASAVIGLVLWRFLLAYCWMYIDMYSPMPRWLVAHGAKGVWFYLALVIHDTVINVLVCLPAALALRRLRPRKPWLYLSIAVLTGFIWEYRMFFEHPALPRVGPGLFVYGILSSLAMLPLATIVLGGLSGQIRRWRAAS